MKSGISIVCREVCYYSGDVMAYLCKKDADDRDLDLVRIRSMLNPELRYFAIRTCVADNVEELEDLLRFLKRRRLTDSDIDRYGGIVWLL